MMMNLNPAWIAEKIRWKPRFEAGSTTLRPLSESYHFVSVHSTANLGVSRQRPARGCLETGPVPDQEAAVRVSLFAPDSG